MPGSNNFLQFNEKQNNIMSNPDYKASSVRTGGFERGKAPSVLINKLFYQLSTMAAALGEALKNKGYEVQDGAGVTGLEDLTEVLENIMTRADMLEYYTAEEVQRYVQSMLVSVPVGSIHAMANTAVPSGYLKCDGSAVSRTTYASLFAAIGTGYGVGDGLSTFNLPDYRGYFLRGWDNGRGVDPDAASRTDRGDGTGGDQVGTKQQDEFKSHKHAQRATLVKDEMYGVGSAGDPGTTLDNNTIQNTGGNETRPKNINVMYVIKY